MVMIDSSTRREAFRAAEESAVVSDLTHLGTLRIDGDDAGEFLQSQLSSDVRALSAGGAEWSSFNSAKGRMIASLRLWADPADGPPRFGALIAADLAAPTAKRLSMFVLRARARVWDASTSDAV